MKMILSILLGMLAFLFLFIAWSSYPWSIGEEIVESQILNIEPQEWVEDRGETSVVKILSWNIGYVYGEGSEGPGYEYKDKNFYESKLQKMVQEIQEWDADILCLQEIDFDSYRSHHINQAEYIAKMAGYPYMAMAPSWEANYIPFPYWPFSRHFKKVHSGGAILSRYPLLTHEYRLLAKPASQPWWYNLFYLHRYFQKVSFQVNDKTFKLINLHLEAFDKIDREGQVKLLRKVIKQQKIDFVAGDFNTVPTSALKKSKFPNGDDYENDHSFEMMLKSDLLEVIPDEIYSQSEASYFTFPSSKPDRRLDYIYYNTSHKMMKAEVLPSALSDHLPIRASFQVDSPKFNPYSQ